MVIGRITVAKRIGDKSNRWQTNVSGQYWQKYETKSEAMNMAQQLRKKLGRV
jgi:hypothetical protein